MTMTSTERTLRRAATAPSSPAGGPLKAAKRSLSKLGRKHSNGSVQSTSSAGTAKSVDGVSIRQPAKSRIRRNQHRLSSVFSRSMLTSHGDMAVDGEDLSLTDDPSELSSNITAPGILKIFGNEICEGANYKSVLATTHSSAKELVKEALERYSLNKAEASAYVLCDVIGCMGERGWRSECVRVVGDNERPLLLQSLWKPREGYARRFEIHRRASVEEKISRDKDTVTAGINAQARKLQKTRSRGRSVALDSGEHGIDAGFEPSLCRSLSEADLRTSPEPQQSLKSHLSGDDSEAVAYKGLHCLAGKKEETESGDDNHTQYSIHPPMHFPYFLLLQGFSYQQDFIIYPLNKSSTVFGCDVKQPEEQMSLGVILCAPDIQPQHCCIQQLPAPDCNQEIRNAIRVTLTPLHGALVKRNGTTVNEEVELHSGDVISLGEHYLFVFKNPNTQTLENSPQTPREPSQPYPTTLLPLYQTCVSMLSHLGTSSAPEKTMPCLRDSRQRKLNFWYDVENETQIIEEIFMRADSPGDTHKLTASLLLSLCLQHSATHFPMTDLRRLLLHIANDVQLTVLERAKELAAIEQHEIEGDDHVDLLPVNTNRLVTGLQPLVMWMANSIEILHFVHQEVPCLLYGLSRMEEEEEEDCMAVLELRLSTVRPASEEAMTVLEEVIMFSFQQCVYYLTKLLYPILPTLLDSNPFSKNGQLQIPDDIANMLDVLRKTLGLVRSCHVHPEMSFQLFTYLFFFINAFLFNLLMERGSGGSFYHWSCGVQIRANLDMLMDWAYTVGLGELAQNHLLKLSTAVNLLATTKEHLLQASWRSLRVEFSSLGPAQLHHILREYDLRWSCPLAWTPCSDEAHAAHQTADILESFDDHPPLVLPLDGFVLDLKSFIGDMSLINQLKDFIKTSTEKELNTRTAHHSECESVIPLEAKRTKMEVLPKAHLELGHAQVVLPQTSDPANLSVCESSLNQKLKALEIQNKEENHSEKAKHHSCLLTPPKTPLVSVLTNSEDQVYQCCNTTKQKEGECEQDETANNEVFVLELQKGPRGLGLTMEDGLDYSELLEVSWGEGQTSLWLQRASMQTNEDKPWTKAMGQTNERTADVIRKWEKFQKMERRQYRPKSSEKWSYNLTECISQPDRMH